MIIIGKKRIISIQQLFFVFSLCFFVACGKSYTPRPYGYFRVQLPEHEYRVVDTLNLPYSFEISKIARVVSRDTDANKHWIDIEYPSLNGSLYCSYMPVKGDLYELSEESRKIAYKHSIRAESIKESFYENPEQRIYSILYDLDGNTASPLQFVVTDSTRHFFRAALYFNHIPNRDSIAPMVNYVREDVVHLIESFEWKR